MKLKSNFSPRTKAPRPRPGRELGGLYDDEAVVQMAHEEAALGIPGGEWGDNTEVRTVEVIIESGRVAEGIVRHSLHSGLAGIERRLEELKPRYLGLLEAVLSFFARLKTARQDEEKIARLCAEEGLSLPLHSLRRLLLELTGLGLVGVGDLYFLSSAFEIFGLSNGRALSFLPLSQLEVAAISVVVAMLVLSRIGGHLLRGLSHLAERHSLARRDDLPEAEGLRVCLMTKVGALAVVLGGLITLVIGLAQVRATYFHNALIAVPNSLFYLIQVGVVVAAVAMSYAMAHPYDSEWRSVSWRLFVEGRSFRRSYGALAALVGSYNALLRERASYILTHEDWSLSLAAEVRRLVVLAARAYLIGQPEPTERHLIENLPETPVPLLVAEVGAQLEGWRSTLMVYEPLSMDAVEAAIGLDSDEEPEDEEKQYRLFDFLKGNGK